MHFYHRALAVLSWRGFWH